MKVINVYGKVINLDTLPQEEQKRYLSQEIIHILETFGPMKRQLIVSYFNSENVLQVTGCLESLLRTKRVFNYEDYFTVDERLFDDQYYSAPPIDGVENTYQKFKNFHDFLAAQEARQKAFAIYIHFRDTISGTTHWYLGTDPNQPWLVLTFISRDKAFQILNVKDFNALYISDRAASDKDLDGRLFLVNDEEEILEVEKHEEVYCLGCAKVDPANYQVKLKKVARNPKKRQPKIEEK